MIQKIKRFLVIAMMGFTMFAPAMAATASADIVQSLCNGTNQATNGTAATSGNQACGTAGSGNNDLSGLASKIVNIFSIIVGIVAVIMIIYGGFRYITSGGDSGSVGNAKNTLIYAIVGLIIVALAQFIVHYVLNTASQSGFTGSGV
ncbi:MAG TPA: pilin [Candidatus Saccharimonadales bacterium]